VLNIDNPMTPHIFRASGLLNRLMLAGQRMSAAPASDRPAQLTNCLPLFAELRQLNDHRFGNSEFIRLGLDACESGIGLLAAFGKPKLWHKSPRIENPCPHCGGETETLLDDLEGELTLCPYCVELFMPALLSLQTADGFRTDAI
jgi:hypothetical protein